ncbi:tRNA epoxyqueuosine(34) reductase QueG [Paenibacillus sp. Marseille-Q4541]|uniref:tRNA epoxyqueuosine(34) reductase QueG n=1 Tax=Paenibacillus sp. Marseille-Q4541 TaxID=2831522 RepID=UPI001BAB7F51|nr:tRNA epoxyqueuosine(34) reductase QueG [Paenibacillus sp. Marseille-Q4541]
MISGQSVPGTAERYEWLKQEIIAAAPSLGIDDIGFAAADPFVSLRSILEEHRANGYESGFEEPDIEKRVNPALDNEKPASLLAIAIAYPSKMKDPPKSEPGKYRGILARSAWGQDYHHVLRAAMDKLSDFIKERVPEARIESMVDTGVLVDRAVSERAGIGFSGKNCSIISPTLGSWIFLGELVTNIPFSPDTPVTEGCGECTKCIDACPTGALVGPGQLNSQKCISFLTQTKGFLDEEYMKKIGNRLYGCDTCQIVCPKNKGKNWDHHPEFEPDPEIVKPLLIPLLDLSNKEFKERFGHSSAAWRGKKPIQRNAIIGLGNFKDKSAVPKLSEVLMRDPRPELRGTAAWALGQIGGEEAMNTITTAALKEEHETVLTMLQRAGERLASASLPKDQAVLNSTSKDNVDSVPQEDKVDNKAQEQNAAAWKPTPVTNLTGTPVYYHEIITDLGEFTLCATEQGLARLDFGNYTVREAHLQQWARTWLGEYHFVHDISRFQEAVWQLEEYVKGERKTFELQLDLRGTPFEVQVWNALADIPYGQTVSSLEVAETIGRPKAVRSVVAAIGKNPLPIIIPHHRITGNEGGVAIYPGGLQVKERLLSLEKQS